MIYMNAEDLSIMDMFVSCRYQFVSHQTVHVTYARDNDLLKLFLDTGWHPCKKKKGDDAQKKFISETKGLKDRI